MTKFENELYDLPRGWIWTQIKEIGANEAYAIVDGPFGSHLKTSDYVKNGKIPAMSITNIDEGFQESKLRYITEEKFNSIKRSAVKPGDIIVAKIGSCGKCGYYPEWMPVGVIPANMLKITVNKLVNRNYVFFYLKSTLHRTFLDRITKSTVQPAFNVSSFRDLPFPLPPAMEQQRISTKIEELFSRLDAGVESLKKVKTRLERYRQAVLKYAFEGKLTEEWRKTYRDKIEPAKVLLERIKRERKKIVENEPGKSSMPITLGLLQLPEDWVWAETKEVAELISGQHILKEDYNFNHSGLPYLTGPADFGSEHPIVTKSTTKPKVIAKDGDVLVTVKGAGVGKVNILNVKEAAISRQLMAIRTSYIIPKFVFYYIRYIFDQIQKLGSGSTVPGIRRENLLELPIPLSSVAEQKKIIEEIESRMQVIDETEKTVEQSLKQAELLRQNILKRAFEGKLVPQDQTEEPAEKLLERIKEEKAKRETKADNKTDPKGQGLMQHVK